MIGERLRKIRKEKKIKQGDLAAAIGVQTSAISRYETDKDDPSDVLKIKIAKYFRISLDYLIGVIDEQVPFYDRNTYLKLPDAITKEESMLVAEFLGYIEYRRHK